MDTKVSKVSMVNPIPMRILITAGPTREPLDPVRYISNRSSGKMGYALAQAALDAGHSVTLITGPVSLPAPVGTTLIPVETAAEMATAVEAHLPGMQLAILAAAVADYKPATPSPKKLKKRDGLQAIELLPTRDILATLGAAPARPYYLVGFAAETCDLAANAQEKLRAKRCDAIVANSVAKPGIGFESDHNEITVFYADGTSEFHAQAPKIELARRLIRNFVKHATKKVDLPRSLY